MNTFPNMNLTDSQQSILRQVKVNGPALMLKQGLLQRFVTARVSPEVGLDSGALDGLSRRDFKAMAGALRQAGLKPSAHGPFLDLAPGAKDRRILDLSRKRYAKGLETAAIFSAEHIVFHPGYERMRHLFYRSEWLEISLETWSPLAQRARELGVRLVMENTHEEHPRDIKPLLTELAPQGVGFCFDIGHASAFGPTPVDEWLAELSPWLKAVHLHDNGGQRDDHLAIGQGCIDFKSFFDGLVKRELRPEVVTLEPHREEQLQPSLIRLSELWPWADGR
jgi:sugar phosphate isomerase/epimerase